MSTRNTAHQICHDEIVAALFQDISKKGYQNVRASHMNLPEEARPEKIYSERAEMFFCPDLSAEKDGFAFIFEIETQDSIDLSLTRVELESFAAYANHSGAYLYIVVPEEIREKAKRVLFGIEARNNHKAFVLTV